ncbi:unnamed protein product [Vicia faba]|uniref:Helicase ATP-binding domain-containing protein n=1 Tax=Vicia faba TaxID=3906 RepID=A0AAV1A9W5_VICFA|nr:unnamed protein product [Vicia faba]
MTGDARLIEEGSGEIETAVESGYPAAQSVLGFLWGMGILRERSKQKAFVYHHFASDGGNMQSKMALAYTYTRQDMFDKSVKLYAELAEVAVNGFLISKDSPVIEPIRLHNGAEENKEALRKSKGEEDEDFQILEYQAQKGNDAAMYKVGLFYYFGLRGLRRDHSKALSWFLKAVEKGEPRSIELLGEIYARGAGVERNYTKAFEWLTLASKHHLYSAYNGIGYLYVKGYGVDSKNYTKAKEYFEKAAENDEVGGHYNLGVMFLKGIGVKRDVRLACKYFIVAANNGQPKAFYQLAKIFHLAPTVVLVNQQYMNIKHNTDLQVEEYHGAKGVDTWNFESWQKEVKDNDVMVMTPHTLLDALRKAFLSIETICLMVIDECHQASGNHPYAKIMVEFYHQANVKPKIFGMTASPIGKRESRLYQEKLDQWLCRQQEGGSRLANVNPAAEANIFGDPDAADVVFTSGADILAVGINVTHQVVLSGSDREKLASSKGKFAQYLTGILEVYFSYHCDAYNTNGVYLHDPTALLAAVDPSLVTCTEGAVRVQTRDITRGLTILYNKQKRFEEVTKWSNMPTVKVAVTVDAPRVVKLVMDRLVA